MCPSENVSVGKCVCRKICPSENLTVGKCSCRKMWLSENLSSENMCRKICRRKNCVGKFAVGKIAVGKTSGYHKFHTQGIISTLVEKLKGASSRVVSKSVYFSWVLIAWILNIVLK